MRNLYIISFFCSLIATQTFFSMQKSPIVGLYKKTDDHRFVNVITKQEKNISENTKGGNCTIWHDRERGALIFQRIDLLSKVLYDEPIILAEKNIFKGIHREIDFLFNSSSLNNLIIEINDKNYLLYSNQQALILDPTPYKKIKKAKTFYCSQDGKLAQIVKNTSIPTDEDVPGTCTEGEIVGHINDRLVIKINTNSQILMMGFPVVKSIYDKIRSEIEKNSIYVRYAPKNSTDTKQQYIQLIKNKNNPDVKILQFSTQIFEVQNKPNDNYIVINAISVQKIDSNEQKLYEIMFEAGGYTFTRFALIKQHNFQSKLYYFPIPYIAENTVVCFDPTNNFDQSTLLHNKNKQKESVNETIALPTLLEQKGFLFSGNEYSLPLFLHSFQPVNKLTVSIMFLPTYKGTIEPLDNCYDYPAEGTLTIKETEKTKPIQITLRTPSSPNPWHTKEIAGVLRDYKGIPFAIIEAQIKSKKVSLSTNITNNVSLWSFLTNYKIPIGACICITAIMLAFLKYKKTY